MTTEYGWHFVGKTLRDGRPVPKVGVTLRHRGELVMCQSGLHYSHTPWEALEYAPGDTLCYVKVTGSVYFNDKGVAKSRTILKKKNVRELLYDFACKEALAVLPDGAPNIVRQYLTETDPKKRDAARDAAWDVAWDAARDAARDVAWDAARDAARDVAWDAARDAARDAAWDVAWDVAWDATRDATWGAAWDATWGAARERQKNDFNQMVYSLFKIKESKWSSQQC